MEAAIWVQTIKFYSIDLKEFEPLLTRQDARSLHSPFIDPLQWNVDKYLHFTLKSCNKMWTNYTRMTVCVCVCVCGSISLEK